MHDQNSQGHSEKYLYGCFAAKKSGLLVFALPMMTRQSHFSFDVGDRRRGTTRPEGHPQIAFIIFGPQITQGYHRESVAGSVIQATGMVKFEDGLSIGNHLNAQNGLQRVCTIPLGFEQGQCAYLCSSGGRLNSNLLGSAWLLGVEPAAGFDSR